MFDEHPTIVVGIDGAMDCDHAIRWAAAEAAARHAPLRLVHAFVWSDQVPLGPTDLAPGLRIQAGRIIATAVATAERLDPSVAVTAAQVDGFPSRVLLTESGHADLLVLGSRALGRIAGLIVSATGRQLTAQARCPVVVVRPTRNARAGSRVVIGYDGSPASAAAVTFGMAHAERHGLTARIVAVHEPDQEPPVLPDDVDATQLEVAELTGHPAELLLQWSADAQLLVVGSRGRGGFAGLLLGSISQTMLHQACCPVAVIPPAAIESPAGQGRSALPELARH